MVINKPEAKVFDCGVRQSLHFILDVYYFHDEFISIFFFYFLTSFARSTHFFVVIIAKTLYVLKTYHLETETKQFCIF